MGQPRSHATRGRGAAALALVRPRNLGIAAAGVAVGGFLALGRAALPAPLLWAMGSALGLGASGNAANDLFDVEADRVNRPTRPLAAGELTRGAARGIAGAAGGLALWAAWWVGPTVFLLAVAALAAMLAYSPWLKAWGLVGNVTVAVVAGLPLVYGAASVGGWRAGVVPAGLAAFLHLAREVVKDLEDMPGDLVIGRRTLPIELGADAGFLTAAGTLALFVPLALIPWAAGWYGWRYGLVVAVLDAGLLGLVWRLAHRRLEGARAALKTAMLLGLVALLWDRL
jgi:geranylgeranylglycerol-phosphate geranylgeranyltransferase